MASRLRFAARWPNKLSARSSPSGRADDWIYRRRYLYGAASLFFSSLGRPRLPASKEKEPPQGHKLLPFTASKIKTEG